MTSQAPATPGTSDNIAHQPTRRFALLSGMAALAGCATGPKSDAAPFAKLGGVKRLDPRLDAIVDPAATVEELGDGYGWAEGPIWLANRQQLLFSDVRNNALHVWDKKGGARVFMSPAGHLGADKPAGMREAGPNGLWQTAKDTIVIADTGMRALTSLNLKTKSKAVLSDRVEGQKFNSPNDLVGTRSGGFYFTDPSFGLENLNASSIKELPYSGIFLRRADGTLTLIDNQLSFPNGIALTDDERTLFVTNCDPKTPYIWEYTLGADGLAVSKKLFYDCTKLMGEKVPGWPDGLRLDNVGNVYMCGPGGVLIFARDGTLLGVIEAGRTIANCAFGEDGHTLFLAAQNKLGRIRLKSRGQAWKRA